MTTEEKTLLTMLTVAAVLVTVVLGAALGWSVWLWPLLAVPLLGAPGLMYRILRRRGSCHIVLQPHGAPSSHIEQQDPTRQISIGSTLQTAFDDYKFHFSATAYWRQAKGSKMQHASPGALVANAIIDWAQTITKVEQPDNVDVVQHRLASALGAVRPDADIGVEVWADNVQLTLSEADQERLCKLAEGRKDRHLWEHEHSHERLKRDYLSNDVLKTTGSTVVWRLAQKDNDVEDTVRLISTLAQLSAAANDKEVDELYRHLVPTPPPRSQLPFPSLNGDQQSPNGSFDDGSHQPSGRFSCLGPFANQWGAQLDKLDDFSPEKLAYFTRCVEQALEKLGKPEEAQEIRRRFDTPVIDKEPTDAPEPDGELLSGPAPEVEPPRQDGQSQADE